MLTGAVRELHGAYPNQFRTDVRTLCPELWENNPFITALEDEDPKVERIDCRYPLIDIADTGPYHCLHGFTEFFNTRLGLAIRPQIFRGDIYLSEREKSWYSQVHEVTRAETPFWIIAAGGKYDVTIKWWETERYQKVVDAFRGRIQFVQVGGAGHHHPKIDGVIDLRGKTSLRELVRLVYHAQGVLCSVTALMHLAAAVETKVGNPPLRPCVVIAGGREPSHWEQYPGHQFIHTVGALPCCAGGGCWKDRAVPLRDGDHRDQGKNLCQNLVGRLPRCLDLIRPEEVVCRIETYFNGRRLSYLTPSENEASTKGIAATSRNKFDSQVLTIHAAGLACDEALARNTGQSIQGNGRGIVICAGGVRYFTNAWVCIRMLRHLGCHLPIEVWHLGPKEMTDSMRNLLKTLDATTVDALRIRKQHPARSLKGWELKPYSIIHSGFREVLFLDADNVPVRNPEYLFSFTQYLRTGAVFWPDYEKTSSNNQLLIWRSCGLKRPNEAEFETGQILLDKDRCRRALELCMWFNENSDFYYQHLHGDKETFHLAFCKARADYYLVQHPIKPLFGTMCQHDGDGNRLFQHRNMAKWDLFRNRRIEGFWLEKECLGFIQFLRKRLNGSVRVPSQTNITAARRMRASKKLDAGLDELPANTERDGHPQGGVWLRLKADSNLVAA
jgi:Mannosyltransferase putative/Glycosyltransferase family 9 (heptosyltransferase)